MNKKKSKNHKTIKVIELCKSRQLIQKDILLAFKPNTNLVQEKNYEALRERTIKFEQYFCFCFWCVFHVYLR